MTAFTELDGVGPARADSLEDAGYDEAEDLAGVDYEELAEEIGVPEDTALEFVVQGENLAEEEAESQPAPEAAESDSEEDEGEDGPLPGDLAEPDTVETEASQSEEETEPEEEVYELVVDLESDIHYDAYMTALLNAFERRHGSHQPTLDAIESVLDDARYNSGEVTHLVTEFEINTLHAAVSQQVTQYKGQNMIDHMDASEELLDQVNAVREAELF